MKFLLTLLVLTFASSAQAKIETIATINSEKLSKKEFNKRYAEVRATTTNPPSKKRFLRDVIRFKLGIQVAKKSKVDQDPRFKELMEQTMFKFWLDTSMSKALRKIKISESDIKSFYNKNPDINVKQIFISVSPVASPSEEAKLLSRAESIVNGLKAGKRSFEEYAKLFSDDRGSKKDGGLLGPRSVNTFHPLVYKAATRLRVGQNSSPVRTPDGIYIVSLVNKVPFQLTNRNIVRLNVFEQKERRAINSFFKKLFSENKISIKKI